MEKKNVHPKKLNGPLKLEWFYTKLKTGRCKAVLCSFYVLFLLKSFSFRGLPPWLPLGAFWGPQATIFQLTFPFLIPMPVKAFSYLEQNQLMIRSVFFSNLKFYQKLKIVQKPQRNIWPGCAVYLKFRITLRNFQDCTNKEKISLEAC